jgi:hypothetical protein
MACLPAGQRSAFGYLGDEEATAHQLASSG